MMFMRMLRRWIVLLLLAVLALQLFFVARIAIMAVMAPQSTTFERSEAWRILSENHRLRWRQKWVDYAHIPDDLKRAVVRSEDDGFAYHEGIDWEALEKAWLTNAKVEATKAAQNGNSKAEAAPKVVGASTITQQLAKNLFLSGERTLWRKAQEFVLTYLLEVMLDKKRILELYLNHVEWGEGIFGAEAAAQHYFRKPVGQLSTLEASRLAVMLPRPRYFEKLPNSAYLAERSAVIANRLWMTELP
jgi:monofunctional biosynthetic peptidoglycan transglycosylase